MIKVAMTSREAEKLRDLLIELRGDSSIRGFCANTSIHWAAWRG